jgi:hypothetical protein
MLSFVEVKYLIKLQSFLRCVRARKEAERLLKLREGYETHTQYFQKAEIYETLK